MASQLLLCFSCVVTRRRAGCHCNGLATTTKLHLLRRIECATAILMVVADDDYDDDDYTTRAAKHTTKPLTLDERVKIAAMSQWTV